MCAHSDDSRDIIELPSLVAPMLTVLNVKIIPSINAQHNRKMIISA